MVLFEIKLICPETNEVFFTSLNSKPILPPPDLFKRVPKPLLIISTKDSGKELKKTA